MNNLLLNNLLSIIRLRKHNIMNKEEEENEKSIYNYNMIFNRINNYEEDIKFNTDLISDIDLQNFDPERYEYYTNLLYIYNKDPKTLYDLLNKYYNIKSMHEKEKGIIKYIYDYARKLKELDEDDKGDGGGGASGGGSIRRRRKRRNRQAGGVNTWQDKFIDVLKSKMPKKEVKKAEASKPVNTSVDEDEYFVYFKEKDGVEELTKKIEELEKKITKIEADKKPSLMRTIYERIFNEKENKKIADLTEQITDLDTKIKELNAEIFTLNSSSSSAVTQNPTEKIANDIKIDDLSKYISELEEKQRKLEEELKTHNMHTDNTLGAQDLEIDEIKRMLLHNEYTLSTSPRTPPRTSPRTPQQAQQQVSQQPPTTIIANPAKAPPDQLSDSLGAITNIASAVLTTSFSGLPSTPTLAASTSGPSTRDSSSNTSDGIATLATLASSLGAGAAIRGGAGNSDEQLKMKYLDNNKYKNIDRKTIKKLLEQKAKNQTDNVDENNKIARLSQDIDAYNSSEKNPEDEKYIIQQLNNFENDPKNPLDELAITFDDRLVFIIATFFIRYITIIIVQWCIDINIIKTFYEGFIYYAIIYIIIFWFIVLFINIDNSHDVKYMNFNGIINSIRTLFYYFYMGTNGISRLLVHTSLIIILIIIPIILNIKRKADYVDDEQTETEKILNNDERKQLSKSLSLFTMFIWLFTSIIATKF